MPLCAQSAPQAEISNGTVRAVLYLPDSVQGYYRATRFDWSGLVSELEFDGHTYFGQWFRNYDPMVHESVMGPVEEFDPVGYEKADPGGRFVKIGVGALKKPEEQVPYSPFALYQNVNHGLWDISKSADRVRFTHTLEEEAYSYQYTKTVVLTEGKPQMVLEHSFKNTGEQRITTQVYDHNFFVIDGMDVGPGHEIAFTFDIEGEGKGIGTFAEIVGNKIVFTKNLGPGENVHLRNIEGFDKTSATDYDIRIENKATGAGVRITSDRPIAKLAFWSATKTVCPEPYIDLKVGPGETFNWKIVYDYYTF